MFTSFIVSGLVVHTPLGPRKSGMPDSVLMPAPVSTAVFGSEQVRRDPLDRTRQLIGHDVRQGRGWRRARRFAPRGRGHPSPIVRNPRNKRGGEAAAGAGTG